MRSVLGTVLLAAVSALVINRQADAQLIPRGGLSPFQTVDYGYGPPRVPADYEANASMPSVHVGDGPTLPAVDASGSSCRGGCDGGLGCDSCGCAGSLGACGCMRCRGGDSLEPLFGAVEYMTWYNRGISLPPLVTTSPQGTPLAAAGVLPAATVLFGNSDIDDDRQSGMRLSLGWWADDCHTLAIAGKLYGVEGGAERFGLGAAGSPIIARPFFNAAFGVQDALLVSFPGVATGAVNVAAANDVLGSELFLRTMVNQGCNYRLDLVTGWQFNRIDSDLAINSQHTQGATTFIFNDLFDVENSFNAGTLGLYGELYHNCLTISTLAKIGIGAMNQHVFISGNNSVIAGGTVTTAGGLLTQQTNMGTFERDVLAWSPEVNVKLSYSFTPRLAVSVGYTFLYWTRVAFAGDQVDLAVNDTQLNGGALVGPARPAFGFRDTDFWVQSIDLGVSFNY